MEMLNASVLEGFLGGEQGLGGVFLGGAVWIGGFYFYFKPFLTYLLNPSV